MKIEKKQLILFSVIVFVLVIFFELQSMSSEGEWICRNGKWSASGNPSDPMPIFDCKKTASRGIAYDVYCEKDDDCACGGHVSKNTCFIGNKRYVDPTKQCEGFCGDGLKLKCVKNQCKQSK